MLAAAARITRSAGVPVTVDAGMTAAELVAELRGMGAVGCNLEDTSHSARALRDPARQAVRGTRLVINRGSMSSSRLPCRGRAGPRKAT
jgi:2-methylisocitrate lyase-like PEP mutase family enzyme